jgi:hypothetical protein
MWRLWVLLGFRPELFAKSLLMEFTVASGPERGMLEA